MIVSKKEIAGMEVLATGWKIVDEDYAAYGGYSYADENGKVEGTVHKVDGPLAHCTNGLHFCENPLNCTSFAQIVPWNNFLKVSAYGEVLPEKDGKRVARILKVEKVLSLEEFMNECGAAAVRARANSTGTANSHGTVDSTGTAYSRGTVDSRGTANSWGTVDSTGTENSRGTANSTGTANSWGTVDSTGTAYSRGTTYSRGTANSWGTVDSTGTAYSRGTVDSTGTAYSHGTVDSTGTAYSWGTTYSRGAEYSYGVDSCMYVRECKGVYNSIFAYKKSGANYLFNKKVKEARIKEVRSQISELAADWFPQFDNAFKLLEKYGSWGRVPPQKIVQRPVKEAYADMPQALEEYLRGLPEFDAKVFDIITGRGEE